MFIGNRYNVSSSSDVSSNLKTEKNFTVLDLSTPYKTEAPVDKTSNTVFVQFLMTEVWLSWQYSLIYYITLLLNNRSNYEKS